MSPAYHLRYNIIPGDHVKADAKALASFCCQHHIEEVVLFVAADDCNNGHLTPVEEDRWFETIRAVKRLLDQAGLVVSLNPWVTLGHETRGRSFPAGRNFLPMLSPLGETLEGCASIACPNWRRYICDFYGRFATLGFRVIWIEDDFRYHNHEPATWGGDSNCRSWRGFQKRLDGKFRANCW